MEIVNGKISLYWVDMATDLVVKYHNSCKELVDEVGEITPICVNVVPINKVDDAPISALIFTTRSDGMMYYYHQDSTITLTAYRQMSWIDAAKEEMKADEVRNPQYENWVQSGL